MKLPIAMGLLWVSTSMACLASDDPVAPRDAGMVADAGSNDAGPNDGGPTGTPCTAAYAGCATFDDRTGAGTDIHVAFPNAPDFRYDPKCVKMKVGQRLIFDGAFSGHPLAQACGPVDGIIAAITGQSAPFTLTQPGIYGYYCTFHGTAEGMFMSGSIEVVP